MCRTAHRGTKGKGSEKITALNGRGAASSERKTGCPITWKKKKKTLSKKPKQMHSFFQGGGREEKGKGPSLLKTTPQRKPTFAVPTKKKASKNKTFRSVLSSRKGKNLKKANGTREKVPSGGQKVPNGQEHEWGTGICKI